MAACRRAPKASRSCSGPAGSRTSGSPPTILTGRRPSTRPCSAGRSAMIRRSQPSRTAPGTSSATSCRINRVPARRGVRPYVYVDEVDETLDKVVRNGGEVVDAPDQEGDLWVATFRDPAGNVIGVWQRGPRDASG